MVSSTGVRETITTLNDLQQRLGLLQARDLDFFAEWTDNLPSLMGQQQVGLERIKQRYDYHRADGLLLEGTINLVVVSPLLELLGFLDPPFRLKSPYGIAVELQDPDEIVRGFIDVLVLQENLWILTVESKRTSIAVPAALPQLLAYMAANPDQRKPNYGMATNGDEFVFLKLDSNLQYDTSRSFSLFPQRHELGKVAQILKALGQRSLEPVDGLHRSE
ncbi:MAG: type I restriction endonuclease subunit R [Leptolyngbyaceae cyanobacterium]